MIMLQLVSTAFLFSLCACGATPRPGARFEGLATYYSDKLHGNTTANGEKYDKTALTAAHRTLPFGTVAKVTNLSNMKSVKVRINDRGPFGKKRRMIDLSRKAAETIDMIQAGVVQVRLEIVSMPPAD